MGKLTVKTIDGLVKAGTAGMTNDGDGLYLKIGQSKGASWIFRYRIAGKLRDMGLGSYPDITLAVARSLAQDAHRIVKNGDDPIAIRDAVRKQKEADRLAAELERERAISFRDIALSYIEAHRSGWKNAKHAQQWTNTLSTYVFPLIGDMPTESITTEHVLSILTPIWQAKTETASRVRNRIELVLDAAKARGLRSGENPARWRGHLDKLMPKRSKIQSVKHHAALPYAELPAFITLLSKQEGFGAIALRFAILTACRTNEVIGAMWKEINLETAIWTIPAERMKAGKEHRVPLCASALSLLSSLPKIDGSPYLFAGQRKNKPLSNQAMTMTLRRMGRGDLTVHGFRSTFRDWAAEQTSYPREVCELSLAHKIADGAEAAYWRSDIFEKRSRLMSDWAQYANGQSAEILRLVV